MQFYETEGEITSRGATTNKVRKSDGTWIELSFYKRTIILKVDNSYSDKEVFNYIEIEVMGDKCTLLDNIRDNSQVRVKWRIAGNALSDGRVFNKCRLVSIEQLGKVEYEGDKGQGFGTPIGNEDDLPF